MNVRVLLVFGTRPEAVKLAPLYFALQRSEAHSVRVCMTAQHREMLDDVMRLFGIEADIDLDLMRAGQSLASFTAAALTAVDRVLQDEAPDVVVVQGDTTTVFVTALAAYYLRIPVAHVEAGLRTGNKYQPFPEEANRFMCDALSDYWLAPTDRAKRNLVGEGYPEHRVHVTGNTGIDALLHVDALVRDLPEPPNVSAETAGLLMEATRAERMLLVTAHRRESFGEGIKQIARALREIAERNPGVSIVYPVHMNPNVLEPMRSVLGGTERVYLVPPVPYDTLVWLMRRSYLILTDSGGIQEEGPSLGKPVLVMRDATERPEAIEAGTSRLVGTRADAIVEHAQELLDDEHEYQAMARVTNPFGDGQASRRIVSILEAKETR